MKITHKKKTLRFLFNDYTLSLFLKKIMMNDFTYGNPKYVIYHQRKILVKAIFRREFYALIGHTFQ